MKLKTFENEIIPEEIHIFYDDLANIYLKSNYEYGRKDEGEIDGEYIGRYLMSKIEISTIDENVDLSFLLYSEEGYIKQDEIVLLYDKYIRLKEIEELIVSYADEIYIVDENIKYIENNKELKEVKEKKKEVNISISGLLLASHIFGTRKLKKFFEKEICYCKDAYPISYFIDDKNYDLSFITQDIKTKKVLPKVDEKDKKDIDVGDEFIGQNEKSLSEQIKEILGETINQKLQDLAKTDKLAKIKEILQAKKKGDDKESYLIKDNNKNRDKLKEKFEKEYKDNYTDYIQDTTNSKIDEKDKKPFNEILKSVDKKDKSVINQEGFNEFRKMGKNNKLKIIDYLYQICSKSKDPLQTLENSLSFLSCKYADTYQKINTSKIIKDYFISKVKNMFIEKINQKLNVNFDKITNEYVTQYGFSDVDDIKFSIEFLSFNQYFKIKEYKFLKLFIDTDNIKRSYILDKNQKRVYKRARRLLDNLLVSIIASMCKLKNIYFDNVKDSNNNILRNSILFIDEYLDGLDIEDYKFFSNIKKFNISNVMLEIIKSNKEYRDISLINIADNMLDKTYFKYTSKDNEDIDKIKKIFPTKSSLEYNMKIRNSYNIYVFYEEIYDNKEIQDEKEYFVCNYAKIKCSMAVDITKLIVPNSDKYIDNKAVANIENTKIIPFKSCSINKVCVPNLANWQSKNDVLINSKKALMNTALTNCSIGGILSIVDANQTKSHTKKIDNVDRELVYKVDDYINIEKIYEYVEKTCFTSYARYFYNNKQNIYFLKRMLEKEFRKILKPKIDEKKLLDAETIIAVDNDKQALVNAKNLIDILEGYFLQRSNIKTINNKYVDVGRTLSKIIDFTEFITNAKAHLTVLYTPYTQEFKSVIKPYWMKRALQEYNKAYSYDELKKRVVIYHKQGGGIDAGIGTPWCASFVNYVVNNGYKSASSQCFYTKEGSKYYTEIYEPKYGAILVIDNKNGTGHCCFIISGSDDGYICLGGNQSKRIKKSFYKKNNKIKGIYWPRG